MKLTRFELATCKRIYNSTKTLIAKRNKLEAKIQQLQEEVEQYNNEINMFNQPIIEKFGYTPEFLIENNGEIEETSEIEETTEVVENITEQEFVEFENNNQ